MLVNVGYRIPFIPINTHSFLLLVVSHYIPIKHHKSPWNYHDTLICEATGGCPLTRWHADACIVVHVENFKRLTATGTLHWVTNWTFHPQKLKNWALSSNQQPPSRVTSTSSQVESQQNSIAPHSSSPAILGWWQSDFPSQAACGGFRISKDSNLQPIYFFPCPGESPTTRLGYVVNLYKAAKNWTSVLIVLSI
jgi:hypothetical protein